MNKKDEFDVFISYNWGIKDKVVKVHENLKNKNLRVWRDDTEIKNNNSPLTEQLAFAIKRSKIILCCMTKKYSDSKNCRLEFQYANDINKTLLILFIDKLKIEELNDSIGFLMSGLVRINCYNNPDNCLRFIMFLKGENFSTIVNKNDENAEIIEIKKINSGTIVSIHKPKLRLNGHTKGVNCLQLIDKNTLASGSWDQTIKIWNFKNSECINTLNGHTTGVIHLLVAVEI
ncbi:sulfur controller-2 [Brachionus plicatilis]|uniref:Sulfur controller-2 n=1 Tax=Brachionus plicatilis TaxID=10195 RepID=A0A3M7RQE6_BRAPC|nr:sulfur controller-2 [Brachionus plicatilis]